MLGEKINGREHLGADHRGFRLRMRSSAAKVEAEKEKKKNTENKRNVAMRSASGFAETLHLCLSGPVGSK